MDRQALLDFVKFQRMYLSLLIDDVADERMTHQPAGIVNHPAWQIGHMAVVMDNCVGMLSGKKILDESWSRRFGQGSKPVADLQTNPSKSELMKVFDERRAALTEAFQRAPADVLGARNPFPFAADGLLTLGRMIWFIMTTHEGTHLGQIAAWRKAVGMPEALTKLSS